jgi:hypothetical protein
MTVQLYWADIPGETGYLVERKSSTNSNFVEVAKLGPDVKSYKDITTVSQTYEYRIRAYQLYQRRSRCDEHKYRNDGPNHRNHGPNPWNHGPNHRND